MALIKPVRIFDPALPFELHDVSDSALDTWHDFVILRNDERQKLTFLQSKGTGYLKVPNDMKVNVDKVIIGVRVENIEVNNVEALIVDGGFYGIVLGSRFIEAALSLNKSAQDGPAATVASAWKDDPDALSVEVYHISGSALFLSNIERFFRVLRVLHNIMLVVENRISANAENVHTVIWDDKGIADNQRLRLTWIEQGSIVVSLKSGATAVLKRLSSIFEVGASARLAQQLADAKKADTDAEISQATRDATAARIVEEQEALKLEHVGKKYDMWRKELRSQLVFLEEAIASVKETDLRIKLEKEKDRAVADLLQLGLFPMVRHVPRALAPARADVMSLPPPPGYGKNA